MDATRFTVGVFNVCNLVLPETPFYGRERYSAEEYERKVAWTAEQLRRMDADIVGFQEVFHLEALEQVLERSGIYAGATVLLGDARDVREAGLSPRNALVTRCPVVEYGNIAAFPPEAQLTLAGNALPYTHFTRPVLWASLRLSAEVTALLFNVHLKSKRPTLADGASPRDPFMRARGQASSLLARTAEALALRYILLQHLQGTRAPVLALGDVNDTERAVTSEIISGAPPAPEMEFDEKRRIWDVALYSVKDVQALRSYQDVYYTHIHAGHYESLDHIFVSDEFMHTNPHRVASVEYVGVLNDHLISEALTTQEIPFWQSDHGQVVATFKLRAGEFLRRPV